MGINSVFLRMKTEYVLFQFLSIEELRKKSVSAKKMMEIIQKSHEEELELEK